jgi:predicted DNA-binding protein (UPF0251 family)
MVRPEELWLKKQRKRGDLLKIADFTTPEIEYLLSMCNFTPDEEKLFRLRCKAIPLDQCAEIMNVSVTTVKRLSKKVKNKIIRVL